MSIRILTNKLTDEVLDAKKRGGILPAVPIARSSVNRVPMPRKNPATILFGTGQNSAPVSLSSVPNSSSLIQSVFASSRSTVQRTQRWSIPGGIAARFGMRDANFAEESGSLPESVFSNQNENDAVPPVGDQPSVGAPKASNGLSGNPASNAVDSRLESPITIELQSH